jgi:hypothetical protein
VKRRRLRRCARHLPAAVSGLDPHSASITPPFLAGYSALARQVPTVPQALRTQLGRVGGDGLATEFGPAGKCATQESCAQTCRLYSTCGKVWYCCDEDAQCHGHHGCGAGKHSRTHPVKVSSTRPPWKTQTRFHFSCACNSLARDDAMCNYIVHDPAQHVAFFYSRIVGSSGCA